MPNKVAKLKGNRVVLEAPKGASSKQGHFFVPEVTTNVGVVRFIGDEVDAAKYEIAVGTKVIYGTAHEQLQIENETVYVMEPSNIVAILED